MAKLTMMSGLPGSGKSTLARKQVVVSGNQARINRDDLRAMLYDSVWTGRRESIVVDCEKAIAEVLLKHEVSPIIDDTNLSPKHRDIWSGFSKKHDIAFEAQKLDVPLEECHKRDASRPKPVGEVIINRLALQAGMIQWPDRKIVIVDVDGTVACGMHREDHLRGERKDWKTYYSKLQYDSPIDIVVRWVRELAKEYTIVIVSGRPDTYQFGTVEWLRKYDIPFDYIFMRPGNLKSPDTEIKKNFLDLMPKDRIFMVLDDRPSVVQMWKSQGLFTIPVRGDIEPF